MYLIGNISIYLGIVISLYGIIANIVGIKKKSDKWLESARGAVLSLAFVASVASFLSASTCSEQANSNINMWLPIRMKAFRWLIS